MSSIRHPDKAARLARAIVADIQLDHQSAIESSVVEDSFFDAMAPQLEEGRRLYESRVEVTMPGLRVLYDQAIVDEILLAQAHVQSSIW